MTESESCADVLRAIASREATAGLRRLVDEWRSRVASLRASAETMRAEKARGAARLQEQKASEMEALVGELLRAVPALADEEGDGR